MSSRSSRTRLARLDRIEARLVELRPVNARFDAEFEPRRARTAKLRAAVREGTDRYRDRLEIWEADLLTRFAVRTLPRVSRAAPVPEWRKADLEVMVARAAEAVGVPTPNLDVTQIPRRGRESILAVARPGRRGKAGKIRVDGSFLSLAPPAVVAGVVAHEVGHLAQRRRDRRIRALLIILVGVGGLVWTATFDPGPFLVWVLLAIVATPVVGVVVTRRQDRRRELRAWRTALELLGKEPYLAVLAELARPKGGPQQSPLPKWAQRSRANLRWYDDRAARAKGYPPGSGPLVMAMKTADWTLDRSFGPTVAAADPSSERGA